MQYGRKPLSVLEILAAKTPWLIRLFAFGIYVIVNASGGVLTIRVHLMNNMYVIAAGT